MALIARKIFYFFLLGNRKGFFLKPHCQSKPKAPTKQLTPERDEALPWAYLIPQKALHELLEMLPQWQIRSWGWKHPRPDTHIYPSLPSVGGSAAKERGLGKDADDGAFIHQKPVARKALSAQSATPHPL